MLLVNEKGHPVKMTFLMMAIYASYVFNLFDINSFAVINYLRAHFST